MRPGDAMGVLAREMGRGSKNPSPIARPLPGKAFPARWITLLAIAMIAIVTPRPARCDERIGDLTLHQGDVPRRLVGYGLVVGLDGSGDRSFGGPSSATPTVRSVINLLRRFNVEIPPAQLHLRNVAAVLVTAEVSPYLRSGGRFEVQVSALSDATSLRGGVLWMTPLVSDPNQPPVATAQGNLYIAQDESTRSAFTRRGNSGRIPQGGVLEVDPPAADSAATRLVLRDPDLATASRIAVAVNAAFGGNTARVIDAGAVSLAPPATAAGGTPGFLVAVDTLVVASHTPPRVVIDGRNGTVVAGADVRVGPAVVSHGEITLEIGGPAPRGNPQTPGLVHVNPLATVDAVAAGLHAAGAHANEIAAIFESLHAIGALNAQVVIR